MTLSRLRADLRRYARDHGVAATVKLLADLLAPTPPRRPRRPRAQVVTFPVRKEAA